MIRVLGGNDFYDHLGAGAGASRGMSYATKRRIRSPLDCDFFELLQKIDPGGWPGLTRRFAYME
jgi:hypothetical protein